MPIPYNRFVLSAPIDTVPAGATGNATRLDDYHVVLAFDDYPDFVFDVTDTEPEVWKAIKPLRPALSLHRLAIPGAAAASFVAGWVSLPQPDFAHYAALYISNHLVTGVNLWQILLPGIT